MKARLATSITYVPLMTFRDHDQSVSFPVEPLLSSLPKLSGRPDTQPKSFEFLLGRGLRISLLERN